MLIRESPKTLIVIVSMGSDSPTIPPHLLKLKQLTCQTIQELGMSLERKIYWYEPCNIADLLRCISVLQSAFTMQLKLRKQQENLLRDDMESSWCPYTIVGGAVTVLNEEWAKSQQLQLPFQILKHNMKPTTNTSIAGASIQKWGIYWEQGERGVCLSLSGIGAACIDGIGQERINWSVKWYMI
jgi:hypothetical protein